MHEVAARDQNHSCSPEDHILQVGNASNPAVQGSVGSSGFRVVVSRR